jgi:hypothetical protein
MIRLHEPLVAALAVGVLATATANGAQGAHTSKDCDKHKAHAHTARPHPHVQPVPSAPPVRTTTVPDTTPQLNRGPVVAPNQGASPRPTPT